MIRFNFSTFKFALPALVGIAVTSCTDSNYDLGNLDKTIAIGNDEGIALPGNNSTSVMVLDNLLDLGTSDVIKTDDNGFYYFQKGAGESEVECAEPVVDEIQLTTVNNQSDCDYDLTESATARRRASASPLSDTAKEIFSFEFDNYENFHSLDVLGISLADLMAGVNIDFTFSEDLKANIGNLREIVIDLPDFFELEIEPSYEAGKNVMTFDKATNTIVITNLTEEGVHVKMTLNRLKFPEVDPTQPYEEMVKVIADGNGYFLYYTPEKVTVYGGILLDAHYDGEAAARAAEAAAAKDLRIHCHSQIDRTVTLTSATGHFNPEIKLGEEGKPLGTFNVDNLPDFLDDPEVRMNVSNSELRVWVNNNMDMKGRIKDAALTATDADGKQLTVELDTEHYPLYIDPHTDTDEDGIPQGSTLTSIIVTDKPYTGVKEPHTYYGVTKNKQLNDLLYSIPKSVSLDCSVEADTTYEGTIRLGYKNESTHEGWYKIQPSYEFFAPLAFNKGSVIIYRDSLTGWHEDLEDVTLSKGARVVVLADVLNEMPFDMKMAVDAIELDGKGGWKKMDSDLINVIITDVNDNELLVKAGSENKPVATRAKIVIEQKNQEGFKRIDGICYRTTALASADEDKQGVWLNSKKKAMKVENLSVKLFGRVIIDFND